MIIGRESFKKICEVEGIIITKEMEYRFLDMEKRGLTNEQKRQEIIKFYAIQRPNKS